MGDGFRVIPLSKEHHVLYSCNEEKSMTLKQVVMAVQETQNSANIIYTEYIILIVHK